MTLAIIIITVLVSLWCFRERRIFETLLLSPYRMTHRKEWWRILTHGFVHADFMHLAINMLVFYSFAVPMEHIFKELTLLPALHFLLLYFGGMAVATVSSIVKHKKDTNYRSVGASGAVAATLFAYMFFQPWSKLMIMGVLPMPGIVFAPIYLLYSMYMSKRGSDNINHDAHFYGAAFGFIYPLLIDPSLWNVFIRQLLRA